MLSMIGKKFTPGKRYTTKQTHELPYLDYPKPVEMANDALKAAQVVHDELKEIDNKAAEELTTAEKLVEENLEVQQGLKSKLAGLEADVVACKAEIKSSEVAGVKLVQDAKAKERLSQRARYNADVKRQEVEDLEEKADLTLVVVNEKPLSDASPSKLREAIQVDDSAYGINTQVRGANPTETMKYIHRLRNQGVDLRGNHNDTQEILVANIIGVCWPASVAKVCGHESESQESPTVKKEKAIAQALMEAGSLLPAASEDGSPRLSSAFSHVNTPAAGSTGTAATSSRRKRPFAELSPEEDDQLLKSVRKAQKLLKDESSEQDVRSALHELTSKLDAAISSPPDSDGTATKPSVI